MTHDTAFQMSASNIRFGTGITREIGMDLQDLQAKRTLVVIDPALTSLPAGMTTLDSLKAANISFDVFDEVSVEPTDHSFRRASEVAREGNYDSFVAVGGGSTIDTAKAANLYCTHPVGDFFAGLAPANERMAIGIASMALMLTAGLGWLLGQLLLCQRVQCVCLLDSTSGEAGALTCSFWVCTAGS